MLDNAVFLFGTALTHELESVEGKNSKEIKRKQDRILSKWLRTPGEAKKFKSPPNATKVAKKEKVSG